MVLETTIDADGIAHLTLNRPEKHNALSEALIDALHAAALGLGEDRHVRAVVLCGAGKSFCAGGDLAWMKAQIAADQATRSDAALKLARMLHALDAMPKPLIGAVQGIAFGGGTGLACVCDAVFAHPDARFGLTETRLGLIPATISPYVIARVGAGRARSVFMSARPFTAARAEALGIVTEQAQDPDARAFDEARAYLACGPEAVAQAKALARSLGPTIDEALIARTIAALADTWAGPEALAGIEAFFDKRPAPWVVEDRSAAS